MGQAGGSEKRTITINFDDVGKTFDVSKLEVFVDEMFKAAS